MRFFFVSLSNKKNEQMELDVKELRIGNLVSLLGEEGKITPSDLVWMDAYPNGVSELYKPIPLTEEWLLKLGFESVEDKQWRKLIPSHNREIYIEIDIEDDNNHMIDIWTATDGVGSWINTKNKFVHQLQNVYFALTGKELE